MRKLILSAALGFGIAFAFASPGFAQAADPSVSQIREAAAAGHLDEAQKMIGQVLTDRPNSAKAHFVQAELYAKEGKISLARAELGNAERLNPGLTEFSARAVEELKAQLGARPAATRALGVPERTGERAGPRVPWGTFLILGIAAAVLFMLFRRRPA
jgi:tetratricopeptide (TPR) repeat protein